jgi:hypothetical protein
MKYGKYWKLAKKIVAIFHVLGFFMPKGGKNCHASLPTGRWTTFVSMISQPS